MTQSNEVLRTLLTNFPAGELPAGEPQRIFECIKTRLTAAPDSGEELKNLYKVKGFSEFAMSLMWMVDRAMRNPGEISIGPEDETLLLASFRKATTGAAEEALETPAEQASGVSERAGEEIDPKVFAGQVEQFVEAVQSGSGGVKMLLEDLVAECERIGQRENVKDLSEFASLLGEFIRFISDSELFDDVRVINILSNVSSTVSSWANIPADAQAGTLEEALNLLRDFRSQFE